MQFRKSFIALVVATSLTACGGGSSTESQVDQPIQDTKPPAENEPTSAVVEGVVTGFGSVYVNGKRYISDNATFNIAGEAGAQESGLKIGMVVKVKASQSEDGTDSQASEIVYEETLQGVISVIDRVNAKFVVMGQEVLFDELTEFEDVAPEVLAVSDVVEVSGFITDEGRFHATFIKLEAEGTETKITGEVTSLDTEQKTFLLGGLTINYAETRYEDMTQADLADGVFVKAEGSQYDAANLNLVAEVIERKSLGEEVAATDSDEVDIAGVVTSYDAATGTFKVNRYRFVIDDETSYEDGVASEFGGNVWVKVEGKQKDDRLVADTIEFKKRTVNEKTEGVVTGVDVEASTFTTNGITFTATNETQYEDKSALKERRFTFDDIAVNDMLKVASKQTDDGLSVALKVKRIDEQDREGDLKGTIQQASVDGITVAGLTVQFTSSTEFEARNGELTLEEFVAYVSENHPVLVKVEGEYEGNVLIAEEVEIDSPRDNRDNRDNGDDGDAGHNGENGENGDTGDNGDAGDNDTAEKRGRVELEGLIEEITDNGVIVAGYELRFDAESELELNEETVTVEAFLAALTIGSILEIEGVWKEQSYVLVTDAEFESE